MRTASSVDLKLNWVILELEIANVIVIFLWVESLVIPGFEQRSVVLLADLQVTCLLQVYLWVELRLCDLETRRIQCFFCVGLNEG